MGPSVFYRQQPKRYWLVGDENTGRGRIEPFSPANLPIAGVRIVAQYLDQRANSLNYRDKIACCRRAIFISSIFGAIFDKGYDGLVDLNDILRKIIVVQIYICSC